MAFSDLVPTLVQTHNGVVNTITICVSAEQLEDKFKEWCEDYGMTPTDINYDNGYLEMENGDCICMSWADKFGDNE